MYDEVQECPRAEANISEHSEAVAPFTDKRAVTVNCNVSIFCIEVVELQPQETGRMEQIKTPSRTGLEEQVVESTEDTAAWLKKARIRLGRAGRTAQGKAQNARCGKGQARDATHRNRAYQTTKISASGNAGPELRQTETQIRKRAETCNV